MNLKRIFTFSCAVLLCNATVTFALSEATTKKILAKMQMPPAAVEVTKVQSIVPEQKIMATGSMRATQGIMVCPEVDGRVTAIYFKAGDEVKAGTKLLQLNPDIVQARLQQAEAELKFAQQDFDRKASLYKTRVVTKSDYDQAVATLAAKRAAVDGGKADLQRTTIVAAFAGRVGLNLVNIGDYVHAGQNLVSLQAVNPIDVEFSIPEVYISKVAVDQIVNLRSDAYPNVTFSGKIYAIDSLVNANTRSVMVRARVPNPEEKLLPGSFVEVDVVLSTKGNVLSLPQTAIVYDTGNTYVYRVEKDHAVKTKVTLGERDQENIVIKDGLKVDDVVISAGQLKVRDGAPVVIVPSDAVAAADAAAPVAAGPDKNAK
jgi:membrane fusion protein, multidrug efflux system